MAIEIERKFLVKPDWVQTAKIHHDYLIRQGYVFANKKMALRVRIVSEHECYLTLKSKITEISNREYEYEIPFKDADEIYKNICTTRISKTRNLVWDTTYDKNWEVDVFHDDNEGLVIAEMELRLADDKIKIPNWIGEEVTYKSAYVNANLAKNPYKKWKN